MADETPTSPPPADLCGYAVVETLAPGATYLAIGPGGRGVVLKRLDPDCLYARQLHPDVHDRLSRVRELAHRGVANLFGVGKQDADAWLIWEFVEGKPLAEHVRDHCRSARDVAALLREVLLTIESLHAQGIVHGAIQSGNVIVTPDGGVRLTHVSPLLYTDPHDDADAFVDMVTPIVDERGEHAGALGRMIADARATRQAPRAVAARLASLADTRGGGGAGAASASAPPAALVREERRTRGRSVVGAAFVMLLAMAAAYWAWHAAGEPGRERVPGWPTWLK